jgi:hypothetical protein
MVVIATLIFSMVLGLSVAYADEVNEKSISVRFVWDDLNDKAGVRPESVAVVLKANGDKMYTKMVNADTWSDTFYNLPAYIDGEAIEYSIDQYIVPNAGLKSEYIHVSTVYNQKENCYTITNKYREGQVVDTESGIVESIYGEETVGEDVIDEDELYQGTDSYQEVESYNNDSELEVLGQKMDETPKTIDANYMGLLLVGILGVISFCATLSMYIRIRRL